MTLTLIHSGLRRTSAIRLKLPVNAADPREIVGKLSELLNPLASPAFVNDCQIDCDLSRFMSGPAGRA